MMGIPIDGAMYTICDAMPVINNTSKPESVFKTKNNTLCYHTLCESVAMGESLTTHIDHNENPADYVSHF